MNDYGTPNILSFTVMDEFHFSIKPESHSCSINFFSSPSVNKLAVLVIEIVQGNLTLKYCLLEI
jgi:hypothetical protein